MHSTFSYFLSIPGQKTRHKVSELDVFVQIHERWYYWKMKRVFTHNAEKSIFPISLNSHGEYSGVHAARGFMSHSPWGLQSRVERLKTRRNSFMISWFSQISNTPTHFFCHFHSPVVTERNEARTSGTQEAKKDPFSWCCLVTPLDISTSYTPYDSVQPHVHMRLQQTVMHVQHNHNHTDTSSQLSPSAMLIWIFWHVRNMKMMEKMKSSVWFSLSPNIWCR